MILAYMKALPIRQFKIESLKLFRCQTRLDPRRVMNLTGYRDIFGVPDQEGSAQATGRDYKQKII